MGVMTLPYDPAEDLTDRGAQQELLDEAFASGDADFIVAALSSVARARWLSQMAETVSPMTRGERESDELRVSALLTAVSALGYKLAPTPA